MVIEGKLHAKFDVHQISESFKKRDFVVEFVDNPLYPQYVTFQLVQDRCGLIEMFVPGDNIEVTFNLRGREWTNPEGEKKYFNTLEAWRINLATESGAKENAPDPNDPSTYAPDGDEDLLPF